MGRGTLESTLKAINLGNWEEVKYVLFDVPSSNQPYELRMEYLKSLKLRQHISIVQLEKCEGKIQLQERLQSIVHLGGEGLMANRPDVSF